MIHLKLMGGASYAEGFIYFNLYDNFYRYNLKEKEKELIKNGNGRIVDKTKQFPLKAIENDYRFLGLLDENGKFLTTDLSKFPNPYLGDFIKLTDSYIFTVKYLVADDSLRIFKAYQYKNNKITEIGDLDINGSCRFIEDNSDIYTIQTQFRLADTPILKLSKLTDNQFVQIGEISTGPFHKYYAYVFMRGHFFYDYSNFLLDNQKLYFIGNSSSNLEQPNTPANLSLYVFDIKNNHLEKIDANILNSNFTFEELNKAKTNARFRLHATEKSIEILSGYQVYQFLKETSEIVKAESSIDPLMGYIKTQSDNYLQIIGDKLIFRNSIKSDTLTLPSFKVPRSTFLGAHPSPERIWLKYQQVSGKIGLAYYQDDEVTLVNTENIQVHPDGIWESEKIGNGLSIIALSESQNGQSQVSFYLFDSSINELEEMFILNGFSDITNLRVTLRDRNSVKIDLAGSGNLIFDIEKKEVLYGFYIEKKTEGIFVFDAVSRTKEQISSYFDVGVVSQNSYYFVNSDGFHVYRHLTGKQTIEPFLKSGTSPELFQLNEDMGLAVVNHKMMLVNFITGRIETMESISGYHWSVTRMLNSDNFLIVGDYTKLYLVNALSKKN